MPAPDAVAPLPGSDLVEAGLRELAAGAPAEAGLLLLVAAPRLRGLGVAVPPSPLGDRAPEDALYARLAARLGAGVHREFNALRRRIVSYAEALERRRQRGSLPCE